MFQDRSACARLFLAVNLVLGVFLLGCQSEEPPSGEVGTTAQALTAEEHRVLAFELVSDWTVWSGSATLANAPLHSEGQHSLAVSFTNPATGYAGIRNTVPISKDEHSAPEVVGFDVWVPSAQQNPWWHGDVQLTIDAPSAGIWGQYLGYRSLQGLPKDQFTRVEFPLPDWIRQALNASAYTDLRFTVALNTTPGNPTHYLDRFILGPDPGSSHCTPVDDNNPCTADDCDPATGQTTHLPLAPGAFCNDGMTCNGTETCDGAGTCNSNALDLDDENPCTIDACDETNGVTHVPAAVGTSCADDTLCNGAETCDGAGACQPGTAPVLDDNNPCTTDSCDPEVGVTHEPVSAGTSCGDDDVCNGLEICDALGSCQAGPAPTVDDENPCTADSCDPAGGVTHTPLGAGTSCDNGNACDGIDACNGAGACVAGAPPMLDDGNACTADSCDPALGVIHVNVSAGTSCDNGNVCDGADACDGAGSCQAGAPPNLDDENPCTADACDPVLGVTHTPLSVGAACGDGDACNGAETCDGAGSCQAGTAVETDDGNACTVGSCDPATGAVSQVPVPVDAPCGDGNACNGAEFCDGAGACQAGIAPDIDDENPCTADSCDPLFGVEHAAEVAGTSCLDSDVCDGSEACDGFGACVEGTPLDLDDDNPCTEDLCDPSTGPSHPAAPAGTNCSDENVCNGTELCDGSGACGAGEPLDPDDGNVCTVDVCDPLLGMQHSPSPAGTSCDDGNICTGSNTCDGAGACQSPGHPDFDDGDPCTVDSCDPVTGVSHEPAGEGSICSDGNACNGLEVCDANGSCNPGTPPLEDDNNPCTADSCDPVAGVLNEPLDPGTSCDLGMCMGSGECTVDALCERTAPGLIPDSDPCTLEFCDEDTGALEVVTCSENNLAALTPTGVTMAYLHAPGGPQKDVESGAFNPETSGAIRGRVLWQDGLGVPNVRVEVLGEPKYGHTRTQIDGNFVLAAPGGREVVLVLTKDGYPSIRRAADVILRGQASIDDVVLVQRDHKSSQVTMNVNSGQVAEASSVSDDDGVRTARVYFPPGTHAWLRMPDDSTVNMSTLNIRATEYTVGLRGPERMPAELPAESAYTYALELTADEAIAAGTDSIEFDRSVYLYTDNFLGFETGDGIPLGYVDQNTGKWVAVENGATLEVVAESGGLATVTGHEGLDSSQQPDVDELRLIAEIFEPGDTFWRSGIDHFSAWDSNQGTTLPQAANRTPGKKKKGDDDDDDDDDDDQQCGSRINPISRTVIQDLTLVGTAEQLHHTNSHLISRELEIPLTNDPLDGPILRVDVRVEVAGQTHKLSFSDLTPGMETTFVWDGRDGQGRPVNGAVPVRVTTSNIYQALYGIPNEFGYRGSGLQITNVPGREQLSVDNTWYATLGSIGGSDFGVGGFSLSSYHFLDLEQQEVFLGDGSTMEQSDIGWVAERILGGGDTTLPSQTLARGKNGAIYSLTSFHGSNQRAQAMDVGVDDRVYTIQNILGASPQRLVVTTGTGTIERIVNLGFPAVAPAVGRDGRIFVASSTGSIFEVLPDDSVVTHAQGMGVIFDMETSADGSGLYIASDNTNLSHRAGRLDYFTLGEQRCDELFPAGTERTACWQGRRKKILGNYTLSGGAVTCPTATSDRNQPIAIWDIEVAADAELFFTVGGAAGPVSLCKQSIDGSYQQIVQTALGDNEHRSALFLALTPDHPYLGGVPSTDTNSPGFHGVFQYRGSLGWERLALNRSGNDSGFEPQQPLGLGVRSLLSIEASADGKSIYLAEGAGGREAIWRIDVTVRPRTPCGPPGFSPRSVVLLRLERIASGQAGGHGSRTPDA